MRTAVIFGGMGFIGIHFAKHLLNQSKNDLIYLIDISEPKDQYCINIYENLKSNNKIKIIIKDIKKDLTNIEISQVDTIYDFAAVQSDEHTTYCTRKSTRPRHATSTCDAFTNTKRTYNRRQIKR